MTLNRSIQSITARRPPAHPSIRPMSALPRRRVLVESTDADLREILEVVLRRAGYDALPTLRPMSGRAWTVADGVILDLPGDTREAFIIAWGLRRWSRWELPIIALATSDELLRAGTSLGFAAVIRKPLHPSRVVVALDRALAPLTVDWGSCRDPVS